MYCRGDAIANIPSETSESELARLRADKMFFSNMSIVALPKLDICLQIVKQKGLLQKGEYLDITNLLPSSLRYNMYRKGFLEYF